MGYGSPQIGLLLESLAGRYQAEILVVEPSIPALAPRHNRFPRFRMRSGHTAFHPHTAVGRIEYVLEAARIIDEWAPDLLVICCTFSLPVLFKLRRRPGYVIYYSYESIPHYGEFDVEMNRHLARRIDLIVFPEENRAALEIGRCRFGDVPKLVLYNCPRRTDRLPLPREERSGRLIYAGMIDAVETYADYYAKLPAGKYPIDLYGPIRAPSEDERKTLRSRLENSVGYCGYIGSGELAEVRRHYIYSLVMWNPGSENQLYAAPNKFFESIAEGVPPLSAPHPQCKKIVEGYGCGVLMSDWSDTALLAGLDRALSLYRTNQWDAMVSKCQAAFVEELNWERQFEKLELHLTRQP